MAGRNPGGTIKITVWLATRDRRTWITAAELFVLCFVLLQVDSSLLRTVFGLPFLAHIGYLSMTSLPIGTIPGRPPDARERRNQDLRSRVVAFLGEVRRAEEYAQRAALAGWPRSEVERNLRAARQRVLNAAAAVAKETGRAPPEPSAGPGAPRAAKSAAPKQEASTPGLDPAFFRRLEESIGPRPGKP